MAIGERIAYLLTSAGPGGVIVVTVILTAATVYTLLTRWILKGGEAADEWEEYELK